VEDCRGLHFESRRESQAAVRDDDDAMADRSSTAQNAAAKSMTILVAQGRAMWP